MKIATASQGLARFDSSGKANPSTTPAMTTHAPFLPANLSTWFIQTPPFERFFGKGTAGNAVQVYCHSVPLSAIGFKTLS
jgi:hypothetical protein